MILGLVGLKGYKGDKGLIGINGYFGDKGKELWNVNKLNNIFFMVGM